MRAACPCAVANCTIVIKSQKQLLHTKQLLFKELSKEGLKVFGDALYGNKSCIDTLSLAWSAVSTTICGFYLPIDVGNYDD